MNLFSWLWTVSWISVFLLSQSLIKAAYAAPRSSNSPDLTASLQSTAPAGMPLAASKAQAQRSLLDAVLPLSTASFAAKQSSPFGIATAKSAAPFSIADLVNPLPQPQFDLLQTPPDYPARGTPSHRLLQLVTSLSRWTRGITESLRLTVPLVTVVQINPPPIDVDRWNVLSLNNPGIEPAAAADLPRESCVGEGAVSFPANLVSLFQVQVRGKPIAEFPLQHQAEQFADRLRQVMQTDHFDPHLLKPVLLDNTPGGRAGETSLFWIESELSHQLDRSGELLAITWINNLRTALDVPALGLVDAQKEMHGLVISDDRLEGTASWYGPYFHGRLTATGETFDQTELTAAHPTLPFDTYLKVTNLETGKAVIVRINDRGPYFEDRSLDLSREAARCLNSEISGVVSYEAIIMKRSSGIFDAVPVEQSAAEAIVLPAIPEDAAADNTDFEEAIAPPNPPASEPVEPQ